MNRGTFAPSLMILVNTAFAPRGVPGPHLNGASVVGGGLHYPSRLLGRVPHPLLVLQNVLLEPEVRAGLARRGAVDPWMAPRHVWRHNDSRDRVGILEDREPIADLRSRQVGLEHAH